MASLKNAAKAAGRAHRERHQPDWRASLGELEKKKDYQARAKDFNRKRDTLKALRLKAEERNPDEFHHHMINSKINDSGVHVEKAGAEDEEDAVAHKAILASQDARYIRYKLGMETRKIEKLEASLHLTAAAKPNRHLFFVDSKEEAEEFTPSEHLQTPPALLKRSANRPRAEVLEKGEWAGAASFGESQRRKAYAELRKRMERRRELTAVLQKLENRRALAEAEKKGAAKPKRLRKGNARNAALYRWQYERKK